MVPNKLVQVDEDSIQAETFYLRIRSFKLCVVKYQEKYHYWRLTMWSVICTVSDNKIIYSLVQGEAPEAEFTGSRRQCLAYIRRMSAE
jgi:hypothetical protein